VCSSPSKEESFSACADAFERAPLSFSSPVKIYGLLWMDAEESFFFPKTPPSRRSRSFPPPPPWCGREGAVLFSEDSFPLLIGVGMGDPSLSS